jgi:hypothetical protein
MIPAGKMSQESRQGILQVKQMLGGRASRAYKRSYID